jgi:hypothetical protein
VTITANDGHGGVASATFPLTVVNVAPTVSPIVVASVVTPSGLQTTLTAAATDPSAADAAAGFVWQWKVDGAVEPGTGNVLGKTFSGCAPHIVSATATDKDGGVSLPRSTTVSGNYQAHFQEPLNEGVNNAVQKGRVVPVKVTVTCNGVAMTGLSPAIQLLTGDQTTGVESVTDYVDTTSASGADTTGVMRASGSSYIYNLQVPSTAAAGALFTIRVRPLAGGNDLRVVLTIRK